MKIQKIQMSETFFLGTLLAAVGGFLDAYTYLCRDHVFANAQTGNMVLLGMNLAEGRVWHAILYLIPITAFGLGIAVTEWIRGRFGQSSRLHWRQTAVAGEILILVVVAAIPAGKWNMAANVLVSFVCAIQVQAFRKMNGNAFATTMCTGNLRSGSELIVCYYKSRDKEQLKSGLKYFGIILCFVLGACLGVLCSSWIGSPAILLAALVLVVVFCLMFVENE